MPPAATFNPSPCLTDTLLASLADPATALTDIAARHNTSLEALSLWIARPDIAERLASIHHIAAVRTRLIAANLLAPALGLLSQVLQHTRAQIDEDAAAPPEKQRTPEQRHRTLESARRAAGKVVSLANFNPIPLFRVPDRVPLASARGAFTTTASTRPPTHPAPTPTAAPTQPTPNPIHQPAPTPFRPPPTPTRTTHRPAPVIRPSRSPASLLAHAGGATTALLDPPFEHWP